jgi:hypothetical protein
MGYRIITRVENPSTRRALVAALRAYGFHPLEDGEGGLPGVPHLFSNGGAPVQVPEEEAADATVLAEQLLKEMAGSGS